MEKLQKERDEFLLYILQRPPPNVRILLPRGAKSVADLNLSRVASPLSLYAKATSANPVEVNLQSVPLVSTPFSVTTTTSLKPKSTSVKRLSDYFMGFLGTNPHHAQGAAEKEVSSTTRRKVNLFFKRRSKTQLEPNSFSEDVTSSFYGRRCTPLSLEGSSTQTLAEYVAPFVAKAEPPPRDVAEFPEPQVLHFFPLIDGSMLNEIREAEDLMLIIYEHVLLGSGLITAGVSSSLAREVLQGYQRDLNITEEQHLRSLHSLMPFGSKNGSFSIDVATIEHLLRHSKDEAFVARMEKVLRICRNYPDMDAKPQKYPLALRAFIFAGALFPFYCRAKEINRTVLREENMGDILTSLRAALAIPISLDPFCRFHAHLFETPYVDDLSSSHRAFLKSVAKSVNALPTRHLNTLPLNSETRYKLYVLQEIFDMCTAPMPLINADVSDETLLCVSALFVESCLSLPTEFLSVGVRLNGYELLPPTNTSSEFLLTLLMCFVERSILSEFVDVAQKLSFKGPPDELLQPLLDMGQRPRRYCGFLSFSIKDAEALAVPGISIAASSVLANYWSEAIANCEVPVDFSAGVEALLDLLVDFSSPGVVGNEEVCRVLTRASRHNLNWLEDLSDLYDAATDAHDLEELQKLKASLTPSPESGDALPQGAVAAVEAFVSQLTLPMPPPLVPSAEDLVRRRLTHAAHCVTAVALALVGPLEASEVPPAAPPLECRALLEAVDKAPPFPPIDDLFARLRCLAHLQRGWARAVARGAERYAAVRLVTGAPPFPLEETRRSAGEALTRAEVTLCECAAMAVVRGAGDLLDKYLRTDMSVYRSRKRDKVAVAERRHLTREFPDVTMDAILETVSGAFGARLVAVEARHLRANLRARMGMHLVAALYRVLLEGADRFFCPEDAEAIAHDMECVEVFLAQTGGDALRLLHWLQRVVRQCFARPSALLIEGDDEVPPLAQLPETAVESPWCKYIVRRVLEHRKDKAAKSTHVGIFSRLLMDET